MKQGDEAISGGQGIARPDVSGLAMTPRSGANFRDTVPITPAANHVSYSRSSFGVQSLWRMKEIGGFDYR